MKYVSLADQGFFKPFELFNEQMRAANEMRLRREQMAQEKEMWAGVSGNQKAALENATRLHTTPTGDMTTKLAQEKELYNKPNAQLEWEKDERNPRNIEAGIRQKEFDLTSKLRQNQLRLMGQNFGGDNAGSADGSSGGPAPKQLPDVNAGRSQVDVQPPAQGIDADVPAGTPASASAAPKQLPDVATKGKTLDEVLPHYVAKGWENIPEVRPDVPLKQMLGVPNGQVKWTGAFDANGAPATTMVYDAVPQHVLQNGVVKTAVWNPQKMDYDLVDDKAASDLRDMASKGKSLMKGGQELQDRLGLATGRGVPAWARKLVAPTNHGAIESIRQQAASDAAPFLQAMGATQGRVETDKEHLFPMGWDISDYETASATTKTLENVRSRGREIGVFGKLPEGQTDASMIEYAKQTIAQRPDLEDAIRQRLLEYGIVFSGKKDVSRPMQPMSDSRWR